ncbi:uncharacterized protein V6R79_021724 [Siganus canaliculatus]
MDPNKSATAPPSDWSGEKSTVGHAPPPPYYDNPSPQAYPQQPQGQGYGVAPQYGQPQPYPGGQQYMPQPGAVTVQPTMYVTQGPLAEPVNDYMCYSIFTMLCCCLPLGIAALIYSISAREANHIGDRMGAERSSRTARTLNHVGLGLGIGVVILSIVYVAVVASVIH